MLVRVREKHPPVFLEHLRVRWWISAQAIARAGAACAPVFLRASALVKNKAQVMREQLPPFVEQGASDTCSPLLVNETSLHDDRETGALRWQERAPPSSWMQAQRR